MDGSFVRVLCALLLEGAFAKNLAARRVYEQNYYYTTYNGSKVTWMMMPDDNGLVVSAIISGLTPNRIVQIEDVSFHLWTRENPDEAEVAIFDKDDLASLNFTKLSPKRPTVFLIHGFTDNIKKPEFFNTLVKAFLSNEDCNVIGVNWTTLACIPWYGQAVKNSLFVGLLTAQAIMVVRNLSPDNPPKIHVVAHNIGTLVAGVAGYNVRRPKINRITGLDPAFIHTSHLPRKRKLNRFDANLVEVIHTSGNYIGFNQPIGHRDFYPNGGKWPQPGCLYDIADRCSLRRAYQYYAEALTTENTFLATKCTSYRDYRAHRCDDQPKIGLVNDIDAKLMQHRESISVLMYRHHYERSQFQGYKCETYDEYIDHNCDDRKTISLWNKEDSYSCPTAFTSSKYCLKLSCEKQRAEASQHTLMDSRNTLRHAVSSKDSSPGPFIEYLLQKSTVSLRELSSVSFYK